ncbi:hypothetical protein GCM10009810_06760 [Nostocoides vanveenii]|uniref:O-antigen ligase-related domain-containing protein n=1 Tax=Nostocoides vanveenii TaxID=330835 RepID=A0ABP4W7Y0_9MICO
MQSIPQSVVAMLPELLIALALLGMLAQALELTLPAVLMRNLAIAMIALAIFLAVLRGERLGGGNGLPLALALFALWISVRVVYEDGAQPVPLLLAMWLPFTFFAAYTSRAAGQRVAAIFCVFTAVAATLYLSTTLSIGLRGGLLINAIFYVILGLPFILAIQSRTMRMAGILVIVTAAAASNKRTAIVALSVALFMYLLTENRRSKPATTLRFRPGLAAGGLILAVITPYWVGLRVFGVDILAKFADAGQDGGSGRAEIYSWVWKRLGEASANRLFFGHGTNAVAQETGGFSAHNDFLEVAYDYGLVGFGLYLFVYACLIATLIKLVSSRNRYAGAWAASLGLFATLSSLSHLALIPTYVALLAVFWGYILRETADSTGSIDGSSVRHNGVRRHYASPPRRKSIHG